LIGSLLGSFCVAHSRPALFSARRKPQALFQSGVMIDNIAASLRQAGHGTVYEDK
jgi:hypothetical protein